MMEEKKTNLKTVEIEKEASNQIVKRRKINLLQNRQMKRPKKTKKLRSCFLIIRMRKTRKRTLVQRPL